MFSDALARHAKMPAELVQSLAILEMQLIEKGAPVWIGQSFKDSVHMVAKICNQTVAYVSAPRNSANGSSPTDRPLLNALARSVLQVKRAVPEVDDPVMGPQDLRPEQARHRLGTSEQIAVNQTLQVDYTNVLANNIHRTDREPLDPGYLHAALLQVDRR